MVRESLAQLQRLQEIAAQIAQTRHDAEMLEIDVRNQHRLLEDRKRRAAQSHERRMDASKEADAAQLSIQQAEDQIKQLNQQMNAVRDNRAMAALQKEIASHRADIQRWEDQCLTALTTADELESDEQRLAEEIAQAQKGLQRVKAEVAEQKARFESELAELEDQLSTAREGIQPGVINAYDRLTGSNLKNPLAAVKGRVCQGCFTQITKQTENLLMRGSEVVYCHSCGRMLVLEDEF
jgi:predicted  nucleic acid-binding Zn-ribbon protein